MIALVTGSSGFVGRHLLAALEAHGFEVVGLRRRDLDFTSDPSSVETAMLGYLESERPDVIFHLAGPKPYADPAELEKLCVGGCRAMLDAIRKYGDRVRLVAAGSSTEYGYSTDVGRRLSEEDEPRPSTPYGKAKLRQTRMVVDAGGTVLRLFNCIGPGQEDDVVAGRIVRQLANDAKRLQLRETSSRRDFLDVRDAVAAFLMAATSLPSGIYNVCSGVAIGIDELAEKAFEAAGISPIPIDLEAPDSKSSYQCGDPAKMESFGWSRKYDLVDSLRDAIAFERKRLESAEYQRHR